MPNTDLTLASIRAYVRTKLGGSSIDVELADGDIDVCLQDSVRAYNRVRPRKAHKALTVTPSVKKYKVDDAHVGFIGVSNVQMIRDRSNIPNPFDPMTQNVAQVFTGSTDSTIGQVGQALTYFKDAENIASAETEWSAQQEDDGYYLYIDVVREGYLVSMEYTWGVTPDDNSASGLKFIDSGDCDWIFKYTLAGSKAILGRMLGKFGGIPGAEGNEEVDAADLKAQADAEIEKLEEVLKLRRRPLPPITG